MFFEQEGLSSGVPSRDLKLGAALQQPHTLPTELRRTLRALPYPEFKKNDLSNFQRYDLLFIPL